MRVLLVVLQVIEGLKEKQKNIRKLHKIKFSADVCIITRLQRLNERGYYTPIVTLLRKVALCVYMGEVVFCWYIL